MKQKNGFVFIETIIVIAVLTTALVLLYSMFTSVLNQEKRRTTYEDVAYLYRTYYLSKFYNDVAKRSITYGIDEKNPMVSIPLVSDASKDFIPEEEQGFYENLMNSSFGITNVYLAGKDIDKLEKCDPDITSCDVLEDLAGSNWKSYLKTLYKNDTYQLITVFGIGENKNGSACFDVFNGNTSVDSTCKFYYSSISLEDNTAVSKLTRLAKNNTDELFTDDTVDHNIRFMGKNPNNYVDIGNGNDEDGKPILWRIIGVMNNVDDGGGKKETRIKLIREKSIGALAWDEKCTGIYNEKTGTCSSTSYKSNWETASLNKLLNGAFYNSTKTTDIHAISYSNGSDIWGKLDYSRVGLERVNKNFIGNAVYHLGGSGGASDIYFLNTEGFYNIERSNSVFNGYPTTWTGKVGLMYPSDYGYATSGGISKNKDACNAKALRYWDQTDYMDCKKNNWLYSQDHLQWTITASRLFGYSGAWIDNTGEVQDNIYINARLQIRPVLYLKPDVKIIGGDGSKSNPYKIAL